MTTPGPEWSADTYAAVAPYYLPMAGHLVNAADVTGDDQVLDVGCGTGNVAITAARRGCTVTGLDITPEMLEAAARNAERAGVDSIEWREGDATDLPAADDTADVTLSALGHMYGDPPEDAGEELLRVTRPGGRVGFTSWTPSSLYPSMAGLLMTHVNPADLPDFSEPPFLWGDPDTVEHRLGDGVRDLSVETGTVWYPARSPVDFVEHTAAHSELFADVFEAVPAEERAAVRDKLAETADERFDPTRNAVGLEYLLATATVSE